MKCKCNNPIYGFNCVCKHIKDYPGELEYTCEWCGIYQAGKKSCIKCELESNGGYEKGKFGVTNY